VIDVEVRPTRSVGHPPENGKASRMRVGRTLGPIVALFDDLDTAYTCCRRRGREYSVTGTADGWAIRKWIDTEVPA
jgi:hypothetical protein